MKFAGFKNKENDGPSQERAVVYKLTARTAIGKKKRRLERVC